MSDVGIVSKIMTTSGRTRPGPNFMLGVDANRPSVGFVDELWFSVDTYAWYVGNGTGWTQLQFILSSIPTGTPGSVVFLGNAGALSEDPGKFTYDPALGNFFVGDQASDCYLQYIRDPASSMLGFATRYYQASPLHDYGISAGPSGVGLSAASPPGGIGYSFLNLKTNVNSRVQGVRVHDQWEQSTLPSTALQIDVDDDVSTLDSALLGLLVGGQVRLRVDKSGAIFAIMVASPTNPPTGLMSLYFKPDGQLYRRTSAGVESLIGGMANPITAAGDIVIGTAPSVPGRLGIGSNGQWLTVASGMPAWANLPVGFQNPMTGVGDIIVGIAAGAPARLGPGSASQVLTMVGSTPAWVSPVSGGMTNPMTTLGDLITGAAGGSPIRLGIGSAGYVLTVVSGAPAWQVLPAPGMANPMTTLGDIITGGASGSPTRLGPGSATQVLTIVGGVPTWQTPAAPGMANPMTTTGDLILGGASGAPGRLGVGANNSVLAALAGAPVWQATITREIDLPIAAADLPDGSGTAAFNTPAQLIRRISTASQLANTPKCTDTIAQFDTTAAAQQSLLWSFTIPPDYSSGGTLIAKISITTGTGGTSGSARGGFATSNDSTTDSRALLWNASDSTTYTVPASYGRTMEFSLTLSTAGALPGRIAQVFLSLYGGTHSGIRVLERLRFRYTALAVNP